MTLLWLEVESGRRSLALVAPLMDHRLYRRLSRRPLRSGPTGRLVRMLVHHHEPGLVDVVAVVRRGDRAGAVCLRLRHRPDGWCVEELGRPEDIAAGPGRRLVPTRLPGGRVPPDGGAAADYARRL